MSTTQTFSFSSIIPAVTRFISHTNQPATKKRYVLLSTKGTNHLENIPDYSEHEAKPKMLSFDQEHDLTSITLTNKQAEHVSKLAHAAGDLLEEDATITLPPNRYFPKNNMSIQGLNTNSPTATPGLLIDIPKYPGIVTGIDVAILDTLMVPNTPALKPYKVSIEKSFVGTVPCETHGTNVAEIIAQGFAPKNTDLQFKNFAVFDCNGSSSTSTIAQAIYAILDYKQGPGKQRKLVVNFSGGGPQSPILNKLFTKLTNNGIGVVVAAGNSAQLCMLDSPASIASSTAVQSVGALGKQGDPVGYQSGQDLATYSNYRTEKERCVNIHYQGCYPLRDAITSTQSIGCGTSFAAPVGTLRWIACTHDHPNANPIQIKQIIGTHSIPAIGARGTVVNGITPILAFAWKTTQLQQSKANNMVEKKEENTAEIIAKAKLSMH